MSFKDKTINADEVDSYWTELAILEFISQLSHMMQEKNISKVELARRLDTSPAYITKVFRGDANFTMRTMVKLVRAVGGKLIPHVTGQTEQELLLTTGPVTSHVKKTN